MDASLPANFGSLAMLVAILCGLGAVATLVMAIMLGTEHSRNALHWFIAIFGCAAFSYGTVLGGLAHSRAESDFYTEKKKAIVAEFLVREGAAVYKDGQLNWSSVTPGAEVFPTKAEVTASDF